MSIVDKVFRWSTPAPNWDGTVPKKWRVSDADAMRQILEAEGYGSAVVYVEYDGDNKLHVGIRDNRDAGKHEGWVKTLRDRLAGLGFKARAKYYRGRVDAIAVIDPVPKGTRN